MNWGGSLGLTRLGRSEGVRSAGSASIGGGLLCFVYEAHPYAIRQERDIVILLYGESGAPPP